MISKENGGIRALLKVLCHKKFSHPSLIIYFFPTPPIKLKLGLQIGGRLITTHLDQSKVSTAGVSLCCALYHQPLHLV
jgi:hypothetical protein